MKFIRIENAGIILMLFFAGIISSCKKDEPNNGDATHMPTPYHINVPSNLPQLTIPSDNPTTIEGVRLGRMLYYDSLLHPNKMHACASCHLQESGFTTPGTQVVPHINMGFSNKFLWDGHLQGTLEDAMKFEVGIFFGTNINDFKTHATYPELFRKAFGTNEVTSKRIEYALAQFLRTLISGNSKFDRFMRHEENLSVTEMIGFQLFNTEKGDCFHCHSLSLMTDGELHNIGLDSVFSYSNAGYFNYTGDSSDLGKFKSPSLRNVALRTSYMHDGRFTTLEEVIQHYNQHVKYSPSLDPIMTKPGKELGLELAPYQVEALKSFLLTLTDSTFISDPAFSSPF